MAAALELRLRPQPPASGSRWRVAFVQAAVMALIAAAAALGTRFFWHPGAPVTEITRSADGFVDIAQAASWGDTVLWVDARRTPDFQRAHIPGAQPLNEDEWNSLLPAFLERWTPAAHVIVYCDGGPCQASRQVAARLRDTGVSPVYVLRGGWPAWQNRAPQ